MRSKATQAPPPQSGRISEGIDHITGINNLLITNFLERGAICHPDKIAIVSNKNTISYKQLNQEAEYAAGWLTDKGIQAGDRVLCYGVNSEHLIAAFFGILKTGAVFVPLHPRTPPAKLRYIIKHCTPSAMVADADILKLTPPGIITIPALLTSDMSTKGKNPGTHQNRKAIISPDSTAAIIYTSGTSRDPRGVVLPHRQVVFVTTAINIVLGNTGNDTILCGLPFSFDYGLYQVFLAFQVGAKLIVQRDFTVPLTIPRLLIENGVTGFPGIPYLFGLLLESRLLQRGHFPTLRYVSSTGDVLPAAMIKKLREAIHGINVFPMYGLTECKRVSIMPAHLLEGYEASVGLPLPGTAAVVVDINGSEAGPNEPGELVVRGPHVMAGYCNDPEETARRFHRDSSGKISLFTGDYFSRDENGFLYFLGRGEMFIKSRGEKVSPLEIEQFLCSVAGVSEAAALGISDPVLGELVWAFVSESWPGALKSANLPQLCAKSLMPAACPQYVEVLAGPLPKTENGKIDRRLLLQMAKENSNHELFHHMQYDSNASRSYHAP